MKKKTLLFLMILIVYTSLFCVIEETASFKEFLYGSAPECEYDNWMSHIAEGIASPGYNIYAPWDRQTDGFGNFEIPTEGQLLSWENIVIMFLEGFLDETQILIDLFEFPFQVVIFTDTDTDRTYHILREIPNMDHYDDNGTTELYDDEVGAFDYGWGLYVYYLEGPYPHITTAPHPNDDFPTVPMAHKVFVEHQSKFLLISGTGREVTWTEEGNYNNSKSTCDPSRVADHPFNTCYQKFCDKIRDEFGHREFSIQIHSYDWGDRHWGFPNVQISAGYNVSSPDLPIRDHSSFKKDIINATGYLVHPANAVGVHAPVYLNDFYGIHYSKYQFTYSDEDTTFAVNNYMDLWGYSQNRQMQYTQAGISQYDNREPFFHIEMDELPNVYPQIINNYHWFQGWNIVSQTWDMEHRFDKCFEYYSPWVDALTEVLPYMYEMNDEEVPVTPTDFHIITECSDTIVLEWTPGDCYDMDSYEIFFAPEPIGNNNYVIRDKSNDATLACLAETRHTIVGLEAGEDYYFKIRIRDKNGNYSELSEEVMGITGPAKITDLETYGRDGYIDISWFVPFQYSCQGFNVYRRTGDSHFRLIDSWMFNPELLGQDGEDQTYFTIDDNVINGEYYIYKVSCEDQDYQEFFYGTLGYASPQKIYEIYVQQIFSTFSDTCYFGMNSYASNGYDAGSFDIPTYDTPSGQYFYCQFYEQYWDPPNRFEQQIDGYYDPETQLRSWVFCFRTNQLGSLVEIGIANLDRDSERLYLYYNGQGTNLSTNTFSIIPTSTDYLYFDLYYGNITPDVTFTSFANQLLYPYEVIHFDWYVDFQVGIEHVNVFAENDEICIPIAMELSPNTSEVDWVVPTLLFENLKLRLDMVMTENDTLTYRSHYKFGIVTPQYIVETYEGWNLLTQNFETDLYSPEEIYGNGSLFYEFFEDEFIEIDEPEFLKPYWLNASLDHYFALNNAQIQRTSYDYELNQGWNIFPNPHRANYNLTQLLFIYDNVTFEFYEAVQNRLIEPFIFEYENRFVPLSELEPRKAYYLFCYEDDITIRFIPYYTEDYSPYFDYDWKLEINATQNSNEGSSIIVGTSIYADLLYNPYYDLLKPLDKPIENSLSFVIPIDFDGDEILTDYHQSLVEPLDTENDFNYEWSVKLQLSSLSQVTFYASSLNLPANHFISLLMPDMNIELYENEDFVYAPSDSLLEFSICIANQFVSGEDVELIPNYISMINYPNPFKPAVAGRSPATTIKYNIPQKGKVKLTIYNIKGQKVKTLVNEVQDIGRYNITWSGKDENNRDVCSGVYFYKLAVNNKKALTRKMLLLR